jgi:hypothetical protein
MAACCLHVVAKEGVSVLHLQCASVWLVSKLFIPCMCPRAGEVSGAAGAGAGSAAKVAAPAVYERGASAKVTVDDINEAARELSTCHQVTALSTASEWQRGLVVALTLHLRSVGQEDAPLEALFHRLRTMLTKRYADVDLPSVREVSGRMCTPKQACEVDTALYALVTLQAQIRLIDVLFRRYMMLRLSWPKFGL